MTQNNSGRSEPPSRRDFLYRAGIAVGGLAVAPAMLAACGATSTTNGGAGSRSSGGVLTVSQAADAITMDPQKQGDVADMNLLINMFDCLTTRDVQNRLVGQLATSWEAVDATTWRFHLRRGVKFHNGEPFNANVVKYSIERLRDPKTKSPIVEFIHVTGVNVVDEYTADIVSDQPNPILPAQSALFDGVMVPPQYLSQVGDATFAQKPVGTGPFKFVEWQAGNQVVMQANPGYWGGKPSFDRLVIKPVPDAATAVASLESGELDIALGLTAAQAQQASGSSKIRLAVVPGIRVFFVALDTLTAGPLRDTRVRQALNYAVDVNAIIQGVLHGDARQIATLAPRQAFGFDPSVSPYPHDLKKARQLMSAAGYANGFSTQLSAPNTSSDIAQAISGQLAKIGVIAAVRIFDVQTFGQMEKSNHAGALGPMYLQGNSGWTLDTESYLQSYIKPDRRYSRYDNPTAAHLIDVEEGTVGASARKKAFTQLQQILKDDAPFIYLYQADLVLPMSTRVRWQPNSLGMQAMNKAAVG